MNISELSCTPLDPYLLQVAEICHWASMCAAAAFEVRVGATSSDASSTLELSGLSRLLVKFQETPNVRCCCKSDMSQRISIDPVSTMGNGCLLLSFSVS